jgi:hypothetical protein
MSTGGNEQEMRWGYAFAGAMALGFAAIVQFVFGELTPEGIEALPAFLAGLYIAAGKLGLTVPLAGLGALLILFDVARGGGGSPKPAAAEPTAAARLNAAMTAAASPPARQTPKRGGPVGKIPGRWRGAGYGKRGATVNTTEQGEETHQEGPVQMGPIQEGNGGRMKLDTERYMNLGRR